jgi:hypothetical protein
MRREPFTPVKLFYDGRDVQVGDYLRSNGGSVYHIDGVSQSPSRPQRRYLKCTRWPPDQVPEGATVHPIVWYPRKAKRRSRLSDIGRRKA